VSFIHFDPFTGKQNGAAEPFKAKLEGLQAGALGSLEFEFVVELPRAVGVRWKFEVSDGVTVIRVPPSPTDTTGVAEIDEEDAIVVDDCAV